MKSQRSKTIFLTIILLCLSVPVSADFNAGGDAYKKGDYETAFREFLPLANGKDHRAMYALGSMYAAGHGVPTDLKKALKWFRKAAAYGRPDAQYKIGLMYDEGLGLKKDYRKALNWYGKSAKSGYEPAQYKVGQMYLEGHGVRQNPVKAYAWLKTATSDEINNGENTLTAVASELTPEQLLEANALAKQYMQKFTSRH